MYLNETGARRVTLRFDREAALWAVLIFIVEVLIATVWSHHRWLRGFIGDVLAVVWVYFLFKMSGRAGPVCGRRQRLARSATGLEDRAGVGGGLDGRAGVYRRVPAGFGI
jgi:hypothetical protein